MSDQKKILEEAREIRKQIIIQKLEKKYEPLFKKIKDCKDIKIKSLADPIKRILLAAHNSFSISTNVGKDVDTLKKTLLSNKGLNKNGADEIANIIDDLKKTVSSGESSLTTSYLMVQKAILTYLKKINCPPSSPSVKDDDVNKAIKNIQSIVDTIYGNNEDIVNKNKDTVIELIFPIYIFTKLIFHTNLHNDIPADFPHAYTPYRYLSPNTSSKLFSKKKDKEAEKLFNEILYSFVTVVEPAHNNNIKSKTNKVNDKKPFYDFILNFEIILKYLLELSKKKDKEKKQLFKEHINKQQYTDEDIQKEYIDFKKKLYSSILTDESSIGPHFKAKSYLTRKESDVSNIFYPNYKKILGLKSDIDIVMGPGGKRYKRKKPEAPAEGRRNTKSLLVSQKQTPSPPPSLPSPKKGPGGQSYTQKKTTAPANGRRTKKRKSQVRMRARKNTPPPPPPKKGPGGNRLDLYSFDKYSIEGNFIAQNEKVSKETRQGRFSNSRQNKRSHKGGKKTKKNKKKNRKNRWKQRKYNTHHKKRNNKKKRTRKK